MEILTQSKAKCSLECFSSPELNSGRIFIATQVSLQLLASQIVVINSAWRSTSCVLEGERSSCISHATAGKQLELCVPLPLLDSTQEWTVRLQGLLTFCHATCNFKLLQMHQKGTGLCMALEFTRCDYTALPFYSHIKRIRLFNRFIHCQSTERLNVFSIWGAAYTSGFPHQCYPNSWHALSCLQM